MTDSVEAYPLHWPEGWARTPRGRRETALYKVTFDHARRDLRNELRRLGAQNVTLSTNVPLRKDGEPYADWREPEDPGVAVYWSVKKPKPEGGFYMQPQVMACDKWRKVRHNLRAVGLAVEALRQLERTGASEILERAFRGFNALPAHGLQRSWRTVLGLEDVGRPTLDQINLAYRVKAAKKHPDVGGSQEEMVELNEAVKQARKACGYE